MKKMKFILLALILALAVGFSFACDANSMESGGNKTYTFEAEGIDFTGLTGFGYSINVSETGMIMGNHTPGLASAVKSSLSNGYFVGYLNTPDTTLVFNIKASAAAKDNTLMLRLGSEYGTLNMDSSAVEVLVNDTALDYNAISVVGKNMNGLEDFEGYTVPFKDYTVSSKFELKAGENTIKIKIKTNTMGIPESLFQSVGPGVDCIKIKSSATLTWESLWEDNKLQEDIK